MLKIKKTLLLALITFLSASNIQTAKPKKRYKARQKKQAKRLAKKRKIKNQKESSYLPWILTGGALVLGGSLLLFYTGKNSTSQNNRMSNADWENFKKNYKYKSVKAIMARVNNKHTINQNTPISTTSILVNEKNIQVTQFNYADPEIFKKLGHKMKNVLLVNGANSTLYFEGDGTNGALSQLVKYHTGYTEWGDKKDLQGKTFTKTTLDVGDVVITTTKSFKFSAPQISIAHILGPGNQDDEEAKNNALEQGIKALVEYAMRLGINIVICPAGIGIFCNKSKPANDRYAALIRGIEDAIKDKKLKINIYLNMWHKDVVQHMPHKRLAE